MQGFLNEESAIKWISTPSSFRRKPESSGLEHPFPLCGYDNKHAPAVRPQAGEKGEIVRYPGAAPAGFGLLPK